MFWYRPKHIQRPAAATPRSRRPVVGVSCICGVAALMLAAAASPAPSRPGASSPTRTASGTSKHHWTPNLSTHANVGRIAATAAAVVVADHPQLLAAAPQRLNPAAGPTSAPSAQPAAEPDVASASALAADGIPVTALRAYRNAARLAAVSDPGCGIPWPLLAGIGRVESDHGRFGGSTLRTDGTTSIRILGPVLNGHGTAVILDTDGGRLDGDTVYDRAVGPVQFIPSTWARYAADGNGDGVEDPSNIFDETVAAADYLCAAGGNLATTAGQVRAVLAYNHLMSYVDDVLSLEHAYARGAGVVVPDPPVTVVDTTRTRTGQRGHPAPPRRAQAPTRPVATTKPTPTPSPTPPGGTGSRGPKPTPTHKPRPVHPTPTAGPTCPTGSVPTTGDPSPTPTPTAPGTTIPEGCTPIGTSSPTPTPSPTSSATTAVTGPATPSATG